MCGAVEVKVLVVGYFPHNWHLIKLIVRSRYWMARSRFFVAAFLAITLGTAATAEQIPVKHIQLPRHEFMEARSETGKIIARVEFTETVQGDEVTMRLTYRFVDGSIDDETTTYRQQGTFRLVRDHHIREGAVLCEARRLRGGSRYRHSDHPHSGQEWQDTCRERAHRPAG